MNRDSHRHFSLDEIAYLKRQIKYELNFYTVQAFCEKHNLNYTNTSRILNGKRCELGTAIQLLKCAGILDKKVQLKVPSFDLETVVKINPAFHFTHEFFKVHVAKVKTELHEQFPVLDEAENIMKMVNATSEPQTICERIEQEYFKQKVLTRSAVISILNKQWFFYNTGEQVNIDLYIAELRIYKSKNKLILDVKKDRLTLSQLGRIEQAFTSVNAEVYSKD